MNRKTKGNMKQRSHTDRVATPTPAETAEQRATRLYSAEGGALIAWLYDEARRRRQTCAEMARELGVTAGYINQLRVGIRQLSHISQEFGDACAAYLGVPPIVVKLLSGRVRVSDFLLPAESEEEQVRRAVDRLLDDDHARSVLPDNVRELSLEAKKVVLMMYTEATGMDVFNVTSLPRILQYLQCAAVSMDEQQEAAEFRRPVATLAS